MCCFLCVISSFARLRFRRMPPAVFLAKQLPLISPPTCLALLLPLNRLSMLEMKRLVQRVRPCLKAKKSSRAVLNVQSWRQKGCRRRLLQAASSLPPQSPSASFLCVFVCSTQWITEIKIKGRLPRVELHVGCFHTIGTGACTLEGLCLDKFSNFYQSEIHF